MIQFYSIPPTTNLPSGSPFCLKLEAFLNFANIDYTKIETSNPGSAPKGKLPYIAIENQKIADTNLIIAFLSEKYEIDIDAKLTGSEKAVSTSFIRLIEEHLYWVIIYSRWIDGDAYLSFFNSMPVIVRSILPRIIKKKITRDMQGHGLLKHSKAEIYAFGSKNITSLSDFLADRKTFFKDHVSLLDITAVAFLSSILYMDIESPLKNDLLMKTNLVEYCAHHYPILFRVHPHS